MSKLRTPRPKEGQIKVAWGYTADDGEAIYYCRGKGVPKVDGAMVHDMLASKRAHPVPGALFGVEWEPSFLEELEARGYDVKTLKISIEKKKD